MQRDNRPNSSFEKLPSLVQSARGIGDGRDSLSKGHRICFSEWMCRLIRWISLAVLAVLVLPILNEFALQHHLYNNPTEGVSMLLGCVRRIGGIPHFEYVLAFVGGLTLGTWIDAIIMGTEGRQSEKSAALGEKAVRVREAIQMELSNVERQRDHASPSLLAEVNSLMLDLRKAGIPVPFAPKGTEVEKWLEMASVYFSHVGPLLRDGHLGEARRVAELVQMRLSPA